MNSAIFFNHITPNELNKKILKSFEDYSKKHDDIVIYLITAPLGEKINYEYEENVIVVLSPGHKIIFLDLACRAEFDEYFDDFISDLGALSNKYKYQSYIGRPRLWKEELLQKCQIKDGSINIERLFAENKISKDLKRKGELIISLLTGCINDIEKIGVEQPSTLLEKVKNKIILFDAEQTRFIYREYAIKKIISVQGLSGTGKTELLLHKLKDLYTKDEDTKIFFTCHNIALAKKIRQRIPPFFDFMKVDRQIKWNERLWVTHAWGSHSNENSGLYAYICNFYGITFYKYSNIINYEFIFSKALEKINEIPPKEFKPCFDYIFVDESQDFPDVFFDLCKKIVKHKVYAAGDVFQDIFGTIQSKPRGVDIILNRCYRTDPRTLMFAHSIGLGLFEKNKLNWFENEGWERLGYKVQENKNAKTLRLSRYPIKRFDDLEIDSSVIIVNNTMISNVCNIIENLQKENPDIQPDDIAIILIDDNKEIYTYIDKLCLAINKVFGWSVSRGYESKETVANHLYITNPNNVKGLEFPYVICITHRIMDSYRYRNTLYTMLTRSFLQSFLLVTQNDKLDVFSGGLNIINSDLYIETSIPTEEQKDKMKQTLLKYQEEESSLSYKDFIEAIFIEQGIVDEKVKEALLTALSKTTFDRFDKEQTVQFIDINKKFY